MKENIHDKVNDFLMEALNDILRIEELSILGRPPEVSNKEIHVIEAVANAEQNGCPGRATDIAAAMRIAPSTLTAAVDALQKKGYLIRERDEEDRRSVRVSLTETGRQAKQLHEAFHRELTDEILSSINEEEAKALTHSLEIIRAFFAKKEAAARKSAVKILADSTCDLTPDEAKQLGVTIIPMSVIFGETVYQQGVTLSTAEFYEKMTASALPPTTTQLTYFDLEMIYREAVQDGSEVVAIHLSSVLSGTYQSAVLAAREVNGVYPVDSLNATFGSALLVREAVKMRDAGKSAAEIVEKLKDLIKRIRLYAFVPTLKYLVRGGRISAVAGLLGSALNILPIITVQDGAVKNIGKVRGKPAAYKEIARLVETAGIDQNYDVVFGHAADPDEISEIKTVLEKLTAGCNASVHEVGPIIGTHTGPGAVGIAFIAKA